jgi:hypothetical protein
MNVVRIRIDVVSLVLSFGQTRADHLPTVIDLAPFGTIPSSTNAASPWTGTDLALV